jgi:hypothetical protein
VLLASDLLTDASLDVFGAMTYVDRDVWFPLAVYGQKLSTDGKLIFQPLTDGVDILDGSTGLLKNRVQVPIQLANVYDALALDNADNLLFAITSTGIAEVNLQSLETMSGRRAGPRRVLGNVQRRHPLAGVTNATATNFLQRPRLRRSSKVGSKK